MARYEIHHQGRNTGYGAARRRNAIAIAKRLALRSPGAAFDIVDTEGHRQNGHHQNGHGFLLDPTKEHTRITRADYPSVFLDYDKDGIPDVDDPHPYGPQSAERIEEVKLSSEVGELLQVRDAMEGVFRAVRTDAMRLAGASGGDFKGRVKTPYSMINALRRKRLSGPKGLGDIIGTSIYMPDRKGVERMRRLIEAGELGPATLTDDFYSSPKAGYRAYHYEVRRPVHRDDGTLSSFNVELQLKSRRIAEIADGTHEPYKDGTADAAAADVLFRLADEADNGDARAAKAIDAVLAKGTRFITKLVRGGPEAWEVLRRAEAAAGGTHAARQNPRRDVQTLLFERPRWTPTSARSWASSHGYKASNADMEITDNHVRIRQADPKGFTTLRTVTFGQGVKAVMGTRR